MTTITDREKKIVDDIINFINESYTSNETQVDLEKVDWINTIDKIVENLYVMANSYRPLSDEDIADNYYLAECEDCGWWGSSKLQRGGNPIGESGDYEDCRCPVCDSVCVYEKTFYNEND